MGFEHAFAAFLVSIFPTVAVLGMIGGLALGIALGVRAEIRKGRAAKTRGTDIPRVYTTETRIYEDDEL